jgi:hypothetical protein
MRENGLGSLYARVVVACLLLAYCSVSGAGVLFSRTLHVGGGTTGDGNMDYLTLPAEFETRFLDLSSVVPHSQIFSNVQWTIADVSATVTITSGTDPGFEGFTTMLTDGIQEWIAFGEYSHPAFNLQFGSENETTDVWGQNPPNGAKDLEGYQIDSYSITLNSLSISNDAVAGTANYTVDYTFTANGEEVPEPSSLGMFLAVGLILVRRKRPKLDLWRPPCTPLK